jgi:hypothetical protein
MKTSIDCPFCEASFSVISISKEEPQYCAFCGEFVKLYEKETTTMVEYRLSEDDELDEDVEFDELDEEFEDEEFDEDFEDEDEEED